MTYAANWSGRTLDKADFKAQLTLGKWLLEKPKKLQDALAAIFRLQQTERQALLAAFKNDVTFHNHVDDDAFSFTYFSLNESTKKAGKALLGAFYTEILAEAGFNGMTGQTTPCLNRTAVEASYRTVNSASAAVCPACLDSLHPPAKRRSMVDLDHFLPKKYYPALAVHPRNLVMTCMQCNERMKLDEDPLGHSGAGALQSSFLPYSRPGLAKIDLHFTSLGSVRIAGVPTEPMAVVRAQNLDRIYALSSRWSNWIESIYEGFRDDLRSRGTLTEVSVRERLLDIASSHAARISTAPRAYLSVRYADWLAREQTAQVLADCIGAPTQIPRPPDIMVRQERQLDGLVEVCAINRKEGRPWLLIRYAGPLLDLGVPISAYVRLNGRDGTFPMVRSMYEARISINHPRNVRPVVIDNSATRSGASPTMTWSSDPAPASEQHLFYYARDTSGDANAWDVAVAFYTMDGKWDSLQGANYNFRFEQ